MAIPQPVVEIKTKTHVSQVIGIAVIGAIGAAAVAGFLFFGNRLQKEQTTTVPTGTAVALTTTAVMTTDKDPLPTVNVLTTEAYTAATAPQTDATAAGILLSITSPKEGAIVDGATPVSAALTDLNRQVTSIRFETYNDRYHYQITWGNDSTVPYGFTPNLGLYPSGEYRHVAKALNAQGTVLATADIMVTFAHTCYYAYQDMTLNAPAATVISGQSFTITGSVKNNIRGNCVNTYNMTTIGSPLPVGWTATFDQPTMTLGIGETKQFTLTVQVPATTASGTYNVGATSQRQYTGFTVTKNVDVSVVRPSGGGGGGPKVIPEN